MQGTKFVVREDHDSFSWMIIVADTHGRLARWRLSMLNLDFKVTYRFGIVNQVPNAV